MIFGVWTIPAILDTSQFYLAYLAQDKSVLWWKEFILELPYWYIWALFTPLIIRLGRRFPIERQYWLKGVLAHFIIGTFFVLIYLAFSVIIAVLRMDSPSINSGLLIDTYIKFTWSFDLYFIIYWAILAASYFSDYYQKYRERQLRAAQLEIKTSQLELQLAQAQLHSLKMQLHPHFLFNTLHTIAAMVRYDNKKAAVRMIAGLSDLLRMTLDNVGKHEVILKEELDFLRRYLEIEQIRFKDRLEVQMEIAPETLNARVPNFILQPLVENSIRHGIASHIFSGIIKISAKRENGMLQMQIYNNGSELPEGWHIDNNSGIGLGNTQARLRQLYGEAYSFELKNIKKNGVAVILSLPFRSEPDEVSNKGKNNGKNSDNNR